MIEVKQDNSFAISDFLPEKVSPAINNPDNKRVEIVSHENLDKRVEELSFAQKLSYALSPEQIKDDGTVKKALDGNVYLNDNSSYFVDNKGVVTMKKSRKRYQIMQNGAWMKID